MSKSQLTDVDIAPSLAKVGGRSNDGIKVLSLSEELGTAEAGPCCVLLWRGAVTHARFRVQKDAMEHVAGKYPGRASILCIIEPASEPPPQELRESASSLLNELGPKLRCVAFVVEGTGFRAAMIRGVLSSVELLKRDKFYPTRYFSHVAVAASWIAELSEASNAEVTRAAGQLRDKMNAFARAH